MTRCTEIASPPGSGSGPDRCLTAVCRPTPTGLALFTLAYLAGAEFGHGLSLSADGGDVVAAWPPSGLFLAALVASRLAAWPRFVAAALCAHLVSDVGLHGVSPLASLGFWAAHALESCAGAWLLRRFVGVPFRCSSTREVLGLVFLGALIGTTPGATVATTVLAAIRPGGSSGYGSTWQAWWCADALGVLLVAPFLLIIDEPEERAGLGLRFARSVERVFSLTMLLAVAQFIFSRNLPSGEAIWQFPYLALVPFLLWIGVRFAPRSGAIAVAMLAVVIVWHTRGGRGPITYLGDTAAQRGFLVLMLVAAITLTALLVSGFVLGRKVAERDLRASEEDYRRLATFQEAILDAADYSIISVDPEGIILAYNAAAERWLGYPAADVVGRCTPCFLHDAGEIADRAAALSRELGVAVEPGFEVFVARARRGEPDEREWTYIRRDGSRFPVVLSITALRDDDGRVTGFLGIGQDVTEKKAAEAALRRAHDDALAAMRAKGEFLANMSHEIRTPMNGVLGMTELLLATPLSDLQRDYAGIIHNSGEALLTVIDDILDFSKVEAGKMVLQVSPFDLRALVEEVADLLAPRAHQKGLLIASRVAPEVPAAVAGDPVRIRQVLTNLAGNAVKFTEEGEVSLEARLLGETPDGVALRIAVRDTGIGIAEDHREEVFESFTQVDGGNSRKHGGTGLGLSICRRLVDLMGGRIGLESTPGGGSTFWFELTLGRAAEAAGGPARADLEGLRVLIVDDQPTNRGILREALLSWKCLPEEAASGAEALARLQASADPEPFDLVLLDQDMPGLDGLQAARAIQAAPRFAGIPLVLLCSLGSPRSAESSEPGRFLATLTKPVRRAPLHDLLCRIIAAPATARADRAAEDCALPVALRVLLVEDNEINRRVAAGMVERLGCALVALPNGREAVEAVEHGGYDLVLMDIQMPEMDGFAATAAIRAREAGTGRHVPIIAMTAHAMRGDRERCLEAGMDGYLTKPVRLRPLREALVAWGIDRARAQPEDGRPDGRGPFDLERIRQSCGGDATFAREVLDMLLESIPGRLDRLEASAAAGDGVRVAWESHGIKGVFLTVGSHALAASFQDLMRSGERGDRADMAATLRVIRDHWDRFRDGARRHLERPEAAALPGGG